MNIDLNKIIEQQVKELVSKLTKDILKDEINTLFEEKKQELNNLIKQPIIDTITVDELIELFDTTTQSIITWRKKYNINPIKKDARPLLFDRKNTLEILQNNGKRIKKSN